HRRAVGEGDDAAVFEETPHDALDPYVLGHSRNARTQATDASHNQVDLHARAARLVERVDDHWVHQGVQLRPDGGRLAFLLIDDLLADQGQQVALHRVRRIGELLQPLW